ncbi:MAG: hypothetical protein H7274_00155 [Rhodoferax sp.]|nr:hypothetical protein [Rhodoferax sp.]
MGFPTALYSHSISVPRQQADSGIRSGKTGGNGIIVVRNHASNASEGYWLHLFGANDSIIFILIYLIQMGIV